MTICRHHPVRALLLLLALVPGPARGQDDRFTPAHVARLRDVMQAAASPDGRHVAYTLTVPRDLAREKDGTSWAELHVAEVQGGLSRPFVTGPVNVSGVAWTPDGKGISFVQKREGDKQPSLYLIPLGGGEARKVLEHATPIQGYSWAPDGQRLAFLATEPEAKEKKEQEEKGFSQEVYEEDLPPVKVWVARADAEEKPKALKLPGSASELHWSPAGDRLALALAPTSLIDDEMMFRKVRVVDPNSGKVLHKLDIPGKMGQLAWSPDGKHLALIAGRDEFDPREGRLWVAPATGSGWTDLLPDYQGHVSGIAWRDAATILYQGDEGVGSVLGTVAVGPDERGRLTARERKVLVPAGGPVLHGVTASDDGQTLALVADSPDHPQEAYVLGPEDRQPRRLTDSNPWLKGLRFARQEVVKHKARDGLALEGILVRPLGEEKGKRYPLILAVHGGPEAHVPNGWTTRYSNPGQVAAARGFAVFYPNYRGSTGRGVEFSMLGQKDAAGKEFDDLVDAVDHLVGTGLVDTARVGVTGGSYGGYATAWCSTYYSDRFAAGVMFVGISDAVSKVGTTDIPWEMYLVHHRKWLWDDWNYFSERSPVYHVAKARTPLLILHGKSDPRVHPGQSLELHRHLKVLGKTPVRLVLYPGEGHGNRRAASRLDYNLRLLQWMEHYLKGPGGSPPPARLDYGPAAAN